VTVLARITDLGGAKNCKNGRSVSANTKGWLRKDAFDCVLKMSYLKSLKRMRMHGSVFTPHTGSRPAAGLLSVSKQGERRAGQLHALRNALPCRI
jgi:hypothetical protein